MSKALDRVESSRLISQEDRTGIDRFKAALKEKQDELAGRNGYERVSDAQLNAFSDYVIQDMEQAEKTVNHRCCHGALDRNHYNTHRIVRTGFHRI